MRTKICPNVIIKASVETILVTLLLKCAIHDHFHFLSFLIFQIIIFNDHF